MNVDELLAQRAVELEDDRPKILISGRRMRDISSDSVRILEQENETRMRFFQFGDVLVEVVEDEKRGILTRHFTQVILKGALDRLANYVKINEKDAQVVTKAILSRRPERPGDGRSPFTNWDEFANSEL